MNKFIEVNGDYINLSNVNIISKGKLTCVEIFTIEFVFSEEDIYKVKFESETKRDEVYANLINAISNVGTK